MTEPRGRLTVRGGPPDSVDTQANPWHALWAMLIGFFMILVDSTIVAVANPSIMDSLGASYDSVIWVTSAYLLAYAVPLLVAGRLGDRFGPKNLYVLGLAVFTVASLWCGLSGSIGMLIAARVLQGIGAALLTPQTLSTITRIFPPERRGVAMSVWGATAGVATLVGPLAGGVLVDSLGWQWIFFVNVPIGLIGIALALWLIPVLSTDKHRFDILGVALSGVGMFLIVFGLQEGQSHGWVWWIWGLIMAGLAAMGAFVYWQWINENEPLIPLRMFKDRNFSLANLGGAVIGFVITAFIVPVMFFAQAVCGLSPTQSALLTAPMAVTTGVLAPFVGRIVDRSHPRPVIGFGFSMLAISLTWLSIEMTPTTAIWRLVLPLIGMGVATAFIFAPLAATATRNLSPQLAGAASGVYNATRQVGSVLGSAAIAAFMTSRISAEMPGDGPDRAPEGAVTDLPAFLREPMAFALSQSLLLPAFVGLFGVVAAMFLLGSVPRVVALVSSNVDPWVVPPGRARTDDGRRGDDRYDSDSDDSDSRDDDRYDDGYYDDDYDDDFADDAYLEVDRAEDAHLEVDVATELVTDQFDRSFHDELHQRLREDDATDVLPVRLAHAHPVACSGYRDGVDPIGPGHNGFHQISDEDVLDDLPRSGRHYLDDPEDLPRHGRHSQPDRD